MTSPDAQNLESHNQNQRDYFEAHIKPNMIPVPSAYLQRHVAEVLKCAAFQPGDRVLEVGCGMGRYTLLLADRGIQVEGLDLSPVLLERLRAYDDGRHDIPLHCADIQVAQPDLEGRFDGVLGFFTLHHIHQLKQTFVQLTKALKPGGRMIFLEPNPYNFFYYLQILITPKMTWKGDKGILQMRKNIILQGMREAGLANSSLRRFGFFPPFLANRSWGASLEKGVERVFPLKTFLPFQIFMGEKPRL